MPLCPDCGEPIDPTGHQCAESNGRTLTSRGRIETKQEPIDAPIAAGELLGRVYRVIRKIGEGGMGSVYEVEHTHLGKRYAAKLLKREIARDREFVARFKQEAIAATRVEHPGIIEVVNLDETDDGRFFLIQELLDGRDLDAELENAKLSLEEIVEIAVQVANALDAAHRAGIVHRDLKPANIFISRKTGALEAKVLDFGVSKLLEKGPAKKLTKTGTALGTPAYMSPEQALAKEVDGR